ncbi:hypothetical protein HALLA_16515 [Halostagnicola larsenii XH-48]|uniref:Geranylgeranyl pyrophosphate synthase n=1 Tax=Halostagnicola larsenii XH-48 TaxID=797299 RepID=W0JV06_9EURY|nr:hypothetical protein [Halostagnicola larsenii]AHG01100.1 hypothetical protein HALLA_16515 [Halostagnicola larsenii XH-48]
MTEHTSTPARETIADRFDRTVPALSPDIRSVAFDALEPVDRSFPVALSRASAAVVSSERPSEQTLESLSLVIEPLQGYVRLRNDLLQNDRYTSATDRDAAILAGDYLHAFAHSSIGEVSTDETSRLELFRALTRGSNALARAYVVPDSDPADLDRSSPADTSWTTTPTDATPTAILAGVAAELGATAVGATETVRESVRTYGTSLSRAIAMAASESAAPTAESPQSVATHILSDRLTEADAGDPTPAENAGSPVESPNGVDQAQLLERELESARAALDTIETIAPNDRALETAEPDPETAGSSHPAGSLSDRGSERDDRSGLAPRVRLERATRIPFEGVLVSDE